MLKIEKTKNSFKKFNPSKNVEKIAVTKKASMRVHIMGR